MSSRADPAGQLNRASYALTLRGVGNEAGILEGGGGDPPPPLSNSVDRIAGTSPQTVSYQVDGSRVPCAKPQMSIGGEFFVRDLLPSSSACTIFVVFITRLRRLSRSSCWK